MSRKALIIIITSVISLSLISGIVFVAVSKNRKNSASASTDASGNDFTYITPTLEDTESEESAAEIEKEVASFVPATEMDLDPSSITVYVNKEYALPKDYKPENLVTPNVRFDITYYDERTLMRPEASKALEKLFTAAEKAGYNLTGVSGYRSYQRQYKIFTNNIITKGKAHTLLYSAVPGTSEHQTGLSIDVSTESLGNDLTDKFADTPEGLWLAKNAYRYGFIIRYPKDKAELTGYAYEPWHIRYVGRGLSYYLNETGLTLDEYYKYTPSPGFDFEALYADIINYVAPTVAVTVTVSPTPSVTPVAEDIKDGDGKGDKPDDGKPNDGKPDHGSDGISVTPSPTPTPGPDATISGIPTEGDTGSDPQNSGDGTSSGTDGLEGTTGTTDVIIE